MAHFIVVVSAPVSADVAWERVLDLRAHGEVIPFTSVRLTSAPLTSMHGPSVRLGSLPDPWAGHQLGAGSRFVARTAWGPVRFDDPMVVEIWRPPRAGQPGFARIRKEGKVIRGWIDIVVAPVRTRPARPQVTWSRVMWSQVISVNGVPRLLDPLVTLVARAAYGWALRRLIAHG